MFAMTRYIGAIDQGTTSTRFIVFDRAGDTIAMAQNEHRQIYPMPGWVEHDPIEIWRNTQAVIAEALRGAGLTRGDLAAVGITNQRETTLLWDRTTGQPIHNALVWQDTRTDPFVANYARDGGQDRFRPLVGLPLATYFSAPKLRWILDNVPAARRAADQLFQRAEAALADGQHPQRAAACGTRRSAVRHDRYLAAVAFHRTARDRRDQRQPHPTDGPAYAGLGRCAARDIRHSA